MRTNSKIIFRILLITIFISACNDDEDPQPEDPILGEWFFKESGVEVISQPVGSEVIIGSPDVMDLKWLFQANDSLYVTSPDTSFINYYRHDTTEMKLYVEDGFYDVLKLSKDSLNLRFHADFQDFEYYVFFKLIR